MVPGPEAFVSQRARVSVDRLPKGLKRLVILSGLLEGQPSKII